MIKHLCVLMLVFLSVHVTAPIAQAKLIIKETNQYYNVSGKTGQEIYSQFGKRGSFQMRRIHAIAATVRTIDFKNIKFEKRSNKCVLSHVDIYLNLTYHYPRWVNVKGASKKARRLWAKYFRALVRHEHTHGKYFKATMRQFERELLKTTGKLSPGCNGMSAIVRNRLRKVYKLGEARHNAFDRRESRINAPVRKLERAFIKAR